MFCGGGYLYGLAVERRCQRLGVGSQLTRARIDRIRGSGATLAVVIAMFWNVGFFRKLGFTSVPRSALPFVVRRLADFRNPLYKRSAVLDQRIEL
jgi:ribosomal protein S18 acetylase RimI-like enzyme